jgi:hypothetical protein
MTNKLLQKQKHPFLQTYYSPKLPKLSTLEMELWMVMYAVKKNPHKLRS